MSSRFLILNWQLNSDLELRSYIAETINKILTCNMTVKECPTTKWKKMNSKIMIHTNFFAGQRDGQFVNILHWHKVCDPEISLFHFIMVCMDLINITKCISICIYYIYAQQNTYSILRMHTHIPVKFWLASYWVTKDTPHPPEKMCKWKMRIE